MLDGEVWIRLQDGSWSPVIAEEGTNQGCPLSSTLAAIVLHAVIAPLLINSFANELPNALPTETQETMA